MAVPSDAASTPSAAEIDAITSRRFSNSFRGWDPDEVRVHLVSVAETVRSLAHRQADLERLLAEAEATARRADLTRLDPDEVSRVLGDETARVLRTAREAASEIEAKAAAQAELLARQAADDAARLRADAQAEATQIRNEAHETADATRVAGEAHLADVQAAGEAELARERGEIEAELAAEREAARDDAASRLAIAQDHASAVRREADEEAARVRSEAYEELAARRAELDAEIDERRAATEEELAALTERAVAQVAEAERMRDRILADLARKRRAARQHLEQLHAGRDRLLTAYEVIRATTDQATGELDVVLGDAKRTADAAARRVGAEDLPTPEEMLAELDLARSAGLPIVAPEVTPADEAGAEDPATVESAEAPSEPVEATDDGAIAGGAEAGPEVVEPVGEPEAPPPGSPDAVAKADPKEDPPPNHRRHTRRVGHRRDPLDGDELPDVPMVPVEASAEFERVRVVPGSTPGDTGAKPSSPGAERTGESPSTATTTTTSAAPTGDEPAPVETSSAEPAIAGPSDAPAGDDAVSGIFARLRAEAQQEPDGQRPEGSEVSKNPDPAEKPKSAAKTQPTKESEPPPKSAAAPKSKLPAKSESASKSKVPAKSESAAKPKSPAKAEPTPKPEPAPQSKAPAKSESGQKSESTERPKASEKPEVADKATAADKPKAAGKPRAGKPQKAAATSAAASDDAELASVFERRDAAVDEVGRRLTKHLKRALSDQQSSLLDDLRQHRGAPVVDELLGAPEAFAASWEPVARADLLGAVAAGVALAGDLDPAASDHADVDVAGPTAELIAAVAEPLRARLARALGEGTSDVEDEDASTAAADSLELADRIRACYREWRGARLATSVTDACARAFGLGVRAAVPAQTGLRWYCGPGDAPCSDCNDNQLEGIVMSGQVFPTGQQVAPAHPGCRCLALPAPG